MPPQRRRPAGVGHLEMFRPGLMVLLLSAVPHGAGLCSGESQSQHQEADWNVSAAQQWSDHTVCWSYSWRRLVRWYWERG